MTRLDPLVIADLEQNVTIGCMMAEFIGSRFVNEIITEIVQHFGKEA